MKLFKGEMKRIRDASDKTEYAIREENHKKFPNNAKPGEPGTMQVVRRDKFIGVNKLSWFHISAKNFYLTIPTDRATFSVTYT